MTDRAGLTGREDYTTFFRQHHKPVLKAMVVRARGSLQVAADATQEAFVLAGERWEEVAAHPNPVAWVYKVAQREVDKELRANQKRTTLDLEDSAHPAVTPVEVSAEVSLVIRSIGSLPERQRQVATLHCIAGYPLVEVAAMLGIKPAAARGSLRSARERIRRDHAPQVPTGGGGTR